MARGSVGQACFVGRTRDLGPWVSWVVDHVHPLFFFLVITKHKRKQGMPCQLINCVNLPFVVGEFQWCKIAHHKLGMSCQLILCLNKNHFTRYLDLLVVRAMFLLFDTVRGSVDRTFFGHMYRLAEYPAYLIKTATISFGEKNLSEFLGKKIFQNFSTVEFSNLDTFGYVQFAKS